MTFDELRIAMEEFWTPDKRKRFGELVSIFWDEYGIELSKLYKMSRGQVQAYILRKFWDDAVKREKLGALVQEFWDDYRGELSAAWSEALRTGWANVDTRRQMSQAISEGTKRKWAEPDHQKRMRPVHAANSETMKAKWAQTEFRTKVLKARAGRTQNLWADPAYKAKQSAAIKEGKRRARHLTQIDLD